MLALETQMLHRSLRECLAVPTMASIIQSDIPFSCKLRLFQTMFDWIFTLSQMECVILTDIQQCRCSCQSSLTAEKKVLCIFDLIWPSGQSNLVYRCEIWLIFNAKAFFFLKWHASILEIILIITHLKWKLQAFELC